LRGGLPSDSILFIYHTKRGRQKKGFGNQAPPQQTKGSAKRPNISPKARSAIERNWEKGKKKGNISFPSLGPNLTEGTWKERVHGLTGTVCGARKKKKSQKPERQKQKKKNKKKEEE